MKLMDLKTNDQYKVLVYGDAGSGKTCFATGFPTPMYVADFDGKINSAARFHKLDQIEGIQFDNYRISDSTDDPFARYEKQLLDLMKMKDDFPFKTVVVDSLTQYGDALLRSIVRRTKTARYNANLPSQQDYHLFTVEFKNFMFRLISLPCNVVVTAHIEEIKDETTGEIVRRPLVVGQKLPKWIPTIFEEMYHAYTETKNNKAAYMLQTQANFKFPARSQIPGLPGVINSTYDAMCIKKGN